MDSKFSRISRNVIVLLDVTTISFILGRKIKKHTKGLLTVPLKIARNRAKNVKNFREETMKIKNQYPRVSEHYFGAGVSFEWPWQLERLEPNLT